MKIDGQLIHFAKYTDVMPGRICNDSFTIMHRDTAMMHVRLDLDSTFIETIDLVENEKVLHFRPTKEQMFVFLETRRFDRARQDKKQILQNLWLEEYNPYDIVRVTHGFFFYEDMIWLQFNGENLKLEDVYEHAGLFNR